MKIRAGNKKAKDAPAKTGFIRKTVTLPAELGDFALAQSSEPEHAGNLSSYVRGLILRDRRDLEKQAA